MKKNIFLIFLIYLVPFTLYSQEQIIPKARIYQSSEGKIFVNRSIPLYFKISYDSSQTSEHFLLHLGSYKEEVLPIYLGKEGLNVFYSPWAVDPKTKMYVYPKRNVSFELYGDSQAPNTKIHNSEVAYSKSDTLFFGKGLRVWLSAKDNVSGINRTYMSINGEAFNEYLQDTITFEQGEYYTIKYYSTDNVGNYEDVKSVSFMIDTTRPLTNLVIYGKQKDNILSSDGKVFLKPQDAFSGTAKTYYFIDNQHQKVYTVPVAVGKLPEGRHILRYFSEDYVKNKESVQSYEFYIDKTPPLVMNEVVGDYIFVNGKAYTSGRSQIQLTAIDNKAGVKDIFYSFDAKNWILYEKSFFLPSDKKNVNIYFYAVDNVGNKGNKGATQTQASDEIFLSELDLIPPKVSYSFSGPKISFFDTLYISSKTKIFINSFDSQSGIQEISYNINEGKFVVYNGSFKIAEEGIKKISVLAIDKVNNMSTLDFVAKVDTTAPEININFSTRNHNIDNEKVYPLGTKITIYAKDAMTNVGSIYYKFNNGSYLLYKGFITIKQKGDYDIFVKANDVLGNYTVEKFSFKIK